MAFRARKSFPYRTDRYGRYIVPANASIQVDPLFLTEKNTNRTGEISLFRLVKIFRTGTNKNKKEKEKEEEDEKNGYVTH